MKNIMIERYNIFGGVNKVLQSSKGMYKFIRPIGLIIIIEGKTYKNDKNIYLKSDSIPILWKKFFLKMANDGDNGLNTFNQHHRERCFSNFDGSKSIC